jgi:hypothetical protein
MKSSPPAGPTTHRYNVGIQHHERQPPVAFERIFQMEADDSKPVVFTQEGPSLHWQGSRGQSRKSRYRSTKATVKSSSSRGVTHVACPAHPEEQPRIGFVPRPNHVRCRAEPLIGAHRSANRLSRFYRFSCQFAGGP